MADDDFSDMTADLEAEADAIDVEFQEKAFGIKPEDQEKPEKKKPVAEETEEEEEEEIPAKPKPLDGDDDDALDINLLGVEEEEEESDEEEDDEAEAEDDDGHSGFDLKDVLKEIEGMKMPKLRTAYATAKAEKEQASLRISELEAEAEELSAKVEEAETQVKRSRTAVPKADITTYEPFKKVMDDYNTAVNSTYNEMSSSANRQALRNNAMDLSTQLAKIQKLDGDEYDTQRAAFVERIEDQFGEDSKQVMSFATKAATLQEKGASEREAFDKESEENSVAFQKKAYDSYTSDIQQMFGNYFEVPDKVAKENPFTLRAYVGQLLKGPEAKKMKKIIEKDLAAVTRLHGGIEPFNAKDDRWRGMDEDTARDQWIEEYDRNEKARTSIAPEVMLEGAMQRRLFPLLLRRLQKLEGKRSSAPAINGKADKGKLKKRLKPEQELEEAEAEFGQAIDAIG